MKEQKPLTIAIAGGTGFVGHHISRQLSAGGHRVIIFSRNPKQSSNPRVMQASWDPSRKQIDMQALGTADVMINLAGTSVVEKRWTTERKAEIRSSRIDATYFLLDALKQHAPGCRVYVAASATGYYGPDRPGMFPFREEAPPYSDFLAEVCADWEKASLSAQNVFRTVVLRTGIVLGKEAGAYKELSAPLKLGVMPVLGGGKQVMSWIHVEDLAKMYVSASLDDSWSGAYNAVAPVPVPHIGLMRAIAKAKGGLKIPVPVPPFVLQLMLGEASVEVLKSCTVSAEKALKQGFSFAFQTIAAAAASIEQSGKA